MSRELQSAWLCAACSGVALLACSESGPRDPFPVVVDGALAPNIALGVDSSEKKRDWAKPDNDNERLVVKYPSGQAWGSIRFLLGLDIPERRPTEDFSTFQTLQLLVAGEWSNVETTVRVGIEGELTPQADAPLYVPRAIELPARPSDGDATYYQISLSAFDQPGQPSPRVRLFAPTVLLFSGGESATVFIEEIALFEARPACERTVCIASSEGH